MTIELETSLEVLNLIYKCKIYSVKAVVFLKTVCFAQTKHLLEQYMPKTRYKQINLVKKFEIRICRLNCASFLDFATKTQ